MINIKIIQEKYIALNKDKILTLKGFKEFKNNRIRLSQVRLFNNPSDVEYYSLKFDTENLVIKKVRVCIETVEGE